MTAVGWYTPPCNPDARAAALRQNLANGYAPVPGVSDHELGWLLRSDAPQAPLHIPNRCTLEVRTVAGPGHWGRLFVALGIVAALGALGGWAV